jgi:hypothetical protein
MGEDDTSAVQHTRMRKVSWIHGTETKLLDDPRVVLRLFGRPRVNSFASRHISWPAMPSIKASPLKAAKMPTSPAPRQCIDATESRKRLPSSV